MEISSARKVCPQCSTCQDSGLRKWLCVPSKRKARPDSVLQGMKNTREQIDCTRRM